MAWFQTSDWNEFQAIREQVLIDLMEAISQVGSSIAFPTRTIHHAPGENAAITVRPADAR